MQGFVGDPVSSSVGYRPKMEEPGHSLASSVVDFYEETLLLLFVTSETPIAFFLSVLVLSSLKRGV